MNKIDFSKDDFEIVGFDGFTEKTETDCARFLPIIRNRETDIFYKWSNRISPVQGYLRTDIEDLKAKKIITLFETPVKLSPENIIVYFSKDFLSLMGESVFKNNYSWVEMQNQGYAFFVEEEETENLLNTQTGILLDLFKEEMIKRFLLKSPEYQQKAEKIIDLARQTARAKHLRSSVFIRIGLVKRLSSVPESLNNLFRLIINQEFPNWTWDSYKAEIDALLESFQWEASHQQIIYMKERAVARAAGSNQLTTTEIGSASSEIAPNFRIPKVVNELLSEIKDAEQCIEAATSFQSQFDEIGEDEIDRVADEIINNSQIKLSEKNLSVLASDPVFYCLLLHKKKPFVHLGGLIETADYYQAAKIIWKIGSQSINNLAKIVMNKAHARREQSVANHF